MYFVGDNASYHIKGISEIKKKLSANKLRNGQKFLNQNFKFTLPGFSASNAIENGLHSRAK